MTLFLDTYEAKNKSKYLKITESRFDKNTKQSKRSSIFLFKEDLDKLRDTLSQISL